MSTDADELARLREDNERLQQELVALRECTQTLQRLVNRLDQSSDESELPDILSELLRGALGLVNANDGALLVFDESTQELVFAVTAGDIPQDRVAWQRLPVGEGIAGWVVSHRRPTICNNAREDDRFREFLDSAGDFHANSVLAAPMVGDGEVIAVIEALNKRGGLFSTADQNLFALVARLAGELLSGTLAGEGRRPPSD